MFKYIIYNYIDYLSFFLLSLGFSSVILGISFFVSINLSDFEKLTSYECGFDPFSDTREPLKIKFYLIAILFIIFDIEVIFFLPWVLCQEQLLLFGYYTMYILCIAVFTLIEIKVMASVQRRKGPNITGFMGFYQPIADGLKLFSKEFIIHSNSNLTLFMLSPVITLFLTFFIFFLIPIVPCYNTLSTPYSTILLLVLSSLSLHGIIFSGWSSNSKYSFLGSIRTASQMVSYEICMSTIFLCIALMSGSFCFNNIIFSQYHLWFIIPLFPLLVFFLIIYFSQFSFKKKMSVLSSSSTINNMKIFSNRKCFYNVKPKNNNDNENVNVSIKSSTHKVKFVDDESFDKDTYIDSKNVSLSKDSYSDSLFFKYFSFFVYLPFLIVKWFFYLILLIIFIILSLIYYFIQYCSDRLNLLDRKSFFLHFFFFLFFFIFYLLFILLGTFFSLILLLTCFVFNLFNIHYEYILSIKPRIDLKKYLYSFLYICTFFLLIYFIPEILLFFKIDISITISSKNKIFIILFLRFILLIYIYIKDTNSVCFSFSNPFFFLNNLFFFSMNTLYDRLVSMIDDIYIILLDSIIIFYVRGMFHKTKTSYLKKKTKMNLFFNTKRKFSTTKIIHRPKKSFVTVKHFSTIKDGPNFEKLHNFIYKHSNTGSFKKNILFNYKFKCLSIPYNKESIFNTLIHSTNNYSYDASKELLFFTSLNENKENELCTVPLKVGKTSYIQNNTQILKFSLKNDSVDVTIFKGNGLLSFSELQFFKLKDKKFWSKGFTDFYKGADNHYCVSIPSIVEDNSGARTTKYLLFVLSSTSKQTKYGSLLSKYFSTKSLSNKQFTFLVKDVYALDKSTFTSLGKESVAPSIVDNLEWLNVVREFEEGLYDGTIQIVHPIKGTVYNLINTNINPDPNGLCTDKFLMFKTMCLSKHHFNFLKKTSPELKEIVSFYGTHSVKVYDETDVLTVFNETPL